MVKPRPIGVRLMEKVVIDDSTGCWIWIAALDTNGYGKLAVHPRGTYDRAHRVAYTLFVGAIPEGLELDHLCRNRACVNPEHLEPVTTRENIMRGNGIGARFARRSHCSRGHLLSADNVYLEHQLNGRHARKCRTCRREHGQLLRERRRSEAAA